MLTKIKRSKFIEDQIYKGINRGILIIKNLCYNQIRNKIKRNGSVKNFMREYET